MVGRFHLKWKELKKAANVDKMNPNETRPALDQLLTKYQSVFGEGVGKLTGMKENLTFIDEPIPVCCKDITIPFALRPRVEEEHNRLEDMGIISKVHTSEWATTVVRVVKKNGKVRVCGDFKETLNPQLMVDQYPLPRIEDILASLSEGEKFTKLDLRQAYLHMEMSDKSERYLTVKTH